MFLELSIMSPTNFLCCILVLSAMAVSVDGFRVPRTPLSRGTHARSRALNVVINNRNRDDRQIELPPSGMKRREPKGSEKKTDTTFFGFTTTAELANGRIAMAFFLFGMYEELTTGKSILEQLGFTNHQDQTNGLMFAGLFGCLALYPTVAKWFTKLNKISLTDSE